MVLPVERVAGRMCHTCTLVTDEVPGRTCTCKSYELVVFGGLTEFKRGTHHSEQNMVGGTTIVELGEVLGEVPNHDMRYHYCSRKTLM